MKPSEKLRPPSNVETQQVVKAISAIRKKYTCQLVESLHVEESQSYQSRLDLTDINAALSDLVKINRESSEPEVRAINELLRKIVGQRLNFEPTKNLCDHIKTLADQFGRKIEFQNEFVGLSVRKLKNGQASISIKHTRDSSKPLSSTRTRFPLLELV
ncbi:MAG: hypothetical protein AAFN77_03100 [Planctomycetota bacterium]